MKTSHGIAARAAAIELLEDVLTNKLALDVALEQSKLFKVLEGSDRSFARLIASATLRRLGEIDTVLDGLLHKPIANNAMPVLHTLRAGVAQLMFLETPPHAAVDTAVAYLKNSRYAGFSGLANAILRRASSIPAMHSESAARTNTPVWLYESWVRSFGENSALAIASAHSEEAPLDISVKQDPRRTADALDGQILPTGSVRLPSTRDIKNLPGFDPGDWWIQDAAAALPAKLIPQPTGKRVIDLCAAPGGKSAQLAVRGANVTAVDHSSERLDLFRQNFKRLHLSAKTIQLDAEKWRPKELADAVLLDAPCSATGTIRRHPDLPYLKDKSDVRRLAKYQSRLLKAAAEMVRPGGHLIYAVCSLQPEEGLRIVNKFLIANKQFVREPIDECDPEFPKEFCTKNGDLQTLPCHWPELGGIDGFFAARLVRLEAS